MTTYKSLTLKIDEDQGNYAKALSSQMSTPQVRKKGMIDLLGITSVINFFQASRIKVDLTRSLHKTPLLLEEFQVTDIYYNNHRMDVITVFREKKIKVPRVHADLDIMSDFYIITQVGSMLKEARVLGYLRATDVIKSRHDNKFYYPAESSVRPIEELIKHIKNPITQRHTKGKHLECVSLFLRFIDGELSSSYKKDMIQHIMTCESCLKRLEDLIEFDRVAEQTRNYPETVEKYYQKVASSPIPEMNKKYPNVVVKKGTRGSTSSDIIINPIKIVPSKNVKRSVPASSIIRPQAESMYSSEIQDEREISPRKALEKKNAIDLIFKESTDFEGNENNLVKFPIFEKKKKIAIFAAVILIVGLSAIGIIQKTSRLALISDVSSPTTAQEEVTYNDVTSGNYDYGEGEDMGLQNLPSAEVASGGIDYELLNTANGEPIIANIDKISWEVSENIAGKSAYKKFLQMVGKNIKLNLQNDLLLTNEFAKNNTIKVDIKFSGGGNVENIKIREGSGSSQIDNIVKKSIGETLSYMKPPNLGLIGKSVEVTLVISL